MLFHDSTRHDRAIPNTRRGKSPRPSRWRPGLAAMTAILALGLLLARALEPDATASDDIPAASEITAQAPQSGPGAFPRETLSRSWALTGIPGLLLLAMGGGMFLTRRTPWNKHLFKRQHAHLLAEIRRRKVAELQLQQLTGYVRTIYDGLSDAVVVFDQAGTILDLNNIAADRFSKKRNDVIGQNMYALLPHGFGAVYKEKVAFAHNARRFTIFEAERDGRNYRVSICPVPYAARHRIEYISISRNITDEKFVDKKLLYMTFHDQLTALYNKAFILRRLSANIKSNSDKQDRPYALLFLDLDNLELVNDNFGQHAGNQLLQHLTSRLLEVLPGKAIVARLGGDEFAVLFEGPDNASLALGACQAIHRALVAPFIVTEHEIVISASIGVVLSDAGHLSAEHVIRDAYIAMYQAKKNGAGQTVVFKEGFRNKILERHALEYSLRQSLAGNELHCVYQPIFSLPGLAITGFEALVRWRHPTMGNITPDRFIPIAEESGLIIDLGRFVIRESSRQMKKWLQEGRVAESATHYCPVKKMLDTRMSQLGWATEAFLIRRSILEN